MYRWVVATMAGMLSLCGCGEEETLRALRYDAAIGPDHLSAVSELSRMGDGSQADFEAFLCAYRQVVMEPGGVTGIGMSVRSWAIRNGDQVPYLTDYLASQDDWRRSLAMEALGMIEPIIEGLFHLREGRALFDNRAVDHLQFLGICRAGLRSKGLSITRGDLSWMAEPEDVQEVFTRRISAPKGESTLRELCQRIEEVTDREIVWFPGAPVGTDRAAVRWDFIDPMAQGIWSVGDALIAALLHGSDLSKCSSTSGRQQSSGTLCVITVDHILFVAIPATPADQPKAPERHHDGGGDKQN